VNGRCVAVAARGRRTRGGTIASISAATAAPLAPPPRPACTAIAASRTAIAASHAAIDASRTAIDRASWTGMDRPPPHWAEST